MAQLLLIMQNMGEIMIICVVSLVGVISPIAPGKMFNKPKGEPEIRQKISFILNSEARYPATQSDVEIIKTILGKKNLSDVDYCGHISLSTFVGVTHKIPPKNLLSSLM